jgi:DNA-binding NarL/FixJ family response regulator
MTVLLADSQRLFDEVLARRLRLEPIVEQVLTAVDAPAAREALREDSPDLVLLDPELTGGPGLAFVEELANRPGGPRVVVVSEEFRPQQVVEALMLGARGWVSKRGSFDELRATVTTVHRGGVALPSLSWGPVVLAMVTDRRTRPERDRFVGDLTRRQRQILALLVRGLSRREVAAELGLSPHTVRTHIRDMFATVGVHSTPSLVAQARLLGADETIDSLLA